MQARILILIALVAVVETLVLFVAAPGSIGPMFVPDWHGWVQPAGAVGVLVGLGWMLVLYRHDPEPDHGSWRYRSRG